MTPLSLILLWIVGALRTFLSSTIASGFPIFAPVKRSNRLAASWVRTKPRLPAPVLILPGAGVAQIAAGHHRRPRQDVKLRRSAAAGTRRPESGCSAAARRPCLACASSREANGPPITSYSSRMAAVFRICFTRAGSSTPGKLHQHFRLGGAAAALLHARFGQAQSVDLLLNGVHALRERVRAQLERFGGLHGQAVIGRIDRRQDPDAAVSYR